RGGDRAEPERCDRDRRGPGGGAAVPTVPADPPRGAHRSMDRGAAGLPAVRAHAPALAWPRTALERRTAGDRDAGDDGHRARSDLDAVATTVAVRARPCPAQRRHGDPAPARTP